MPNGVKIFCFLILLPALAALGHDVYFSYSDAKIKKVDDLGDVQKSLEKAEAHFTFSELGWLWQEYSLPTHNAVKKYFDEQTWNKKVAPALETPAVLALAVPAGISYIVLALLWVLGVWPFAGTSKVFKTSGQKKKKIDKNDFSFHQDIKHHKKGMKYKRK